MIIFCFMFFVFLLITVGAYPRWLLALPSFESSTTPNIRINFKKIGAKPLGLSTCWESGGYHANNHEAWCACRVLLISRITFRLWSLSLVGFWQRVRVLISRSISKSAQGTLLWCYSLPKHKSQQRHKTASKERLLASAILSYMDWKPLKVNRSPRKTLVSEDGF